MKLQVTGCKDCPMYYWAVDDWRGTETKCNHPSAPEQDLVENIDTDKSQVPTTPDWCPLKHDPITIEIIP